MAAQPDMVNLQNGLQVVGQELALFQNLPPISNGAALQLQLNQVLLQMQANHNQAQANHNQTQQQLADLQNRLVNVENVLDRVEQEYVCIHLLFLLTQKN